MHHHSDAASCLMVEEMYQWQERCSLQQEKILEGLNNTKLGHLPFRRHASSLAWNEAMKGAKARLALGIPSLAREYVEGSHVTRGKK